MKLLRLELKKTNIKSYGFAASAIFVCFLGLTYIFAWVPSLGTADPNAVELFSGASAILLFTYPIDRKTVVWAKIKLLLLFISITILVCTFGGFIVFALTGHMFSLVEDNLHLIDIALAYRNSLVLACLTDGIALCSLRIGFIKKSNSMTVISAILFSMLLVNLAADINQSFTTVFCLSVVILVIGLLLTFNMAQKVERMEI